MTGRGRPLGLGYGRGKNLVEMRVPLGLNFHLRVFLICDVIRKGTGSSSQFRLRCSIPTSPLLPH